MPENKEKYYIDKKQYIPDEADLLCTAIDGDTFDIINCRRKSLYRTKRGAYFLVISGGSKTDANVLDETAAFDFMNRNAAGIDTDVYDRIFGIPELG